MKSVLKISLLLVIEIVLAGPKPTKFRCDYTYNKQVDGYIKYQEIPANWNDARMSCHLEGSLLASPLNRDLKNLMVRMANDDRNKAPIWTGIHSTFARRYFTTVDGVPLSQFYHEWTMGEPDNKNEEERCLMQLPDGTLADKNCIEPHPYFCFKRATPDMAMNTCGTTDPEYILNNDTGKCYKYHKRPSTWSGAFMACMAEGGHLAIVNSVNESIAIMPIFYKNLPPDVYKLSPAENEFFVGFSDWNKDGEFLTIHGQTLKEAGFDQWTNLPNKGSNQFCGAFNVIKGHLTKTRCDRLAPYLCEKNPNTLMCYNYSN